MKTSNRHVLRRGPRLLSLILAVLMFAGLFPLLPAREVKGEEELPPLGYFKVENEDRPNAQAKFFTNEQYLMKFMVEGDYKLSGFRGALNTLQNGGEYNDAVADLSKQLLLGATKDYDEENGWSKVLRDSIDGTLARADDFGTFKTLFTLGESNRMVTPFFEFMEKAGDYFSLVGITLSLYDLAKAESGSRDRRDAGLNAFTSTFTLLMSKSANVIDEMTLAKLGNFEKTTWGTGVATPIGIALIGLVLVDTSLKSLHKGGEEMRKQSMKNIYYYYNEVYNKERPKPLDQQKRPEPGKFEVETKDGAWNMGQWRDSYVAIIDKYSKDDPDRILPEIEKLIDDYCERFWELPASKQAELETDLDMKTPLYGISRVSTEDWSKDGRNGKLRKELTEEYKAHLKAKLYAINGSLRKVYAQRLVEPVTKAVNTYLKDVNQKAKIRIDQVGIKTDDKVVYPYDGYIVRLNYINDTFRETSLDEMTVTLDGARTPYVKNMTVLGYVLSGGSVELAFWAPDQDPDKDEPEFIEEIEFDKKGMPLPVVLEGETEDITGQYEIVVLDDFLYEENLNSISEYAGLLLFDDIFASNIGNIGEPQTLTLEIKEEKKGSYSLVYTAKVGNNRVCYQGKEAAINPATGELEGTIKAEVNVPQETRKYKIIFTLSADTDNPGQLKGLLTIGRNNKVIAVYEIELKK